MTVAQRAREAARARPFLHTALRAGVVNYTAAARFLDVGDEEAVAAALRRYAEDLPAYDPGGDRRARVEMHSGLGPAEPAEALLVVGDAAVGPGAGSLTAVLAAGEVGPAALGDVLARLRVEGVGVRAAGAAAGESGEDGEDGHLAVVVGRRDGPDALRLVEDAL